MALAESAIPQELLRQMCVWGVFFVNLNVGQV